jgi:hypothetical protein
MTAGNYSLDAYQNVAGGSWVGTKGSNSWSGADEPRAPRVPTSYYFIYRTETHPRTGRETVRRYKIRRPGFTPKRARHGEHSFNRSFLRLEQALVSFPWGVYPEFQWASAGDWTAATLLDGNDQIKLVNKLVEKLKGSDFNMSVFLGEGHQTLKLLGDTAIKLAKAGYHAKKLDLLGAARALFEGTTRKPLARHDWTRRRPGAPSAKNASSLWLELQYGWLPLLKDAEACAQSLAHYLNYPCTQTYRVQVRRETNTTVTALPDGTTKVTHLRTKSHRRSLVARISEKPTGWATLGLLDPELVAWELLPFSFVADWFIPIGSWMEARAWASRLTGTFITSNKRYARAGPVLVNGGSRTPSVYRQMLFDRSISTTLAVPMPQMKSLGKVASWQHCANAIALVTQVFTGGKVRS